MLQHLRHEIPHLFGGRLLHPTIGVGVGAQGKSGVVVAQHGGHRFHIRAALERHRGKGVAEIWICQALTNRI